MVKRLLLVAGLTVGLVLVTSTAGAQQYPPGTFPLTLSDTTVVPGQTITATGTLTPGATSVSFAFHSEEDDLGSTTPDAAGNHSASLTIPTNATLGSHTITATDNLGAQASAGVTVVAAGGGAGAAGAGGGAAGAGVAGAGAVGGGAAGGLATTGDNSSLPLLRVGAVLLALGGLLVFLTRRREESAVSST
jgi:hypothetical protein